MEKFNFQSLFCQLREIFSPYLSIWVSVVLFEPYHISQWLFFSSYFSNLNQKIFSYLSLGAWLLHKVAWKYKRKCLSIKYETRRQLSDLESMIIIPFLSSQTFPSCFLLHHQLVRKERYTTAWVMNERNGDAAISI